MILHQGMPLFLDLNLWGYKNLAAKMTIGIFLDYECPFFAFMMIKLTDTKCVIEIPIELTAVDQNWECW